MDIIIDLHRLENENEEQFIFRLGQAKDSGNLDMSWDEIANIINKEFRSDESEYRSEAAYRKPYQQAKRYFEANVFKTFSDKDTYFKELQIQKDAVYKEKRKLYDQRREYNKLLTSDARAEHLNEELVKAANRLNEDQPLIFNEKWFKPNIHKEAIMFWRAQRLCHRHDRGHQLHGWRHHGHGPRPDLCKGLFRGYNLLRRLPDRSLRPGRRGPEAT